MDASSIWQDSLPVTSDALIAGLDALGIGYRRYDHVPLRTVADAKLVQDAMGAGLHVKNLYLRDRKKKNWLVTLEQDRDIDLKRLGDQIGAAGLSFGSEERLMEHLGIRPGAVSPLAMVTGVKMGVTLVLDAKLREAEVVHMHPLVNDRTVAMSPAALLRWLDAIGAAPVWLEI
ncbi:aminoacyl-tRNA deacylase [Gemmobacter aquarius]|uniref:Aminoacyl-tRNA deacylase n=1 Tax=Paragemmobacter aquarius TaxID=2169400 RepID=A0A2S0UKS5_9RHOB|nr:prolyl-tRNA synthetase associated domain-containing protein [Gemmobacter aquarius]AWB48391.1 aminoacyl-tRNA deacylase [Gemmobacter aquarius]